MTEEKVLAFNVWASELPKVIVSDSLWEFRTYQKALYLTELAWFDCRDIQSDPLGRPIASQLIRSAGSVAAIIEEGYGRGFGKDYARFLRIALGSARESKGWYFRGRRLIDEKLYNHRIHLLDDIISGLILAANQQRKQA